MWPLGVVSYFLLFGGVSSQTPLLTEAVLHDPVTSSGNTMTVRFTSDASKNKKGFVANYTAVDVTQEFGRYRCANNVTFIDARKRCDGKNDCGDGSDEDAETCACQDIPPSLTMCKDIEYQKVTLPNPLNYTHTTVEKILNSAIFSDLSTLANSGCHPRVRDFVCAVTVPRCESRSNVTQQLPCRSWCEEVQYSCSKEASWSAIPSCRIFSGDNCNNIMPSRTTEGELCFDGNGANYRGDAARGPLTGLACQPWNDDHYYMEVYPWANLVGNKCPYPDGKSRHVRGCKDPGNPRFGTRNPKLKFYWPGDRITYSCDVGFKFAENSPPSKSRCGDYIWHLKHDLILNSRIYNKEVSATSSLEARAYVVKIINLIWIDERLSWDPADYGGLHHFHIRDDLVWKPTLALQGNADTRYSGGFPATEVDIANTGEVVWPVESLARTTCDLDPFLFPQDNMTCPVCWKAVGEYTIECSDHESHEDENFLTCHNDKEAVEDGEWSGIAILSATDNTACLTIKLKRDPTYHFSTTISPCFILIILMVITFIMPIDKGDRIGFGVTVLLAMVVSLVVITGFLPVSSTLPFIALLIIVCMALMALFMLTTVFIIIIHDKKGPVPKWARTLFLKHLARALMMGDLTKKLKNETQTDYTYSNVGMVNGKHTKDSLMFEKDFVGAEGKLPRKVKDEVGDIIGVKLDELNNVVKMKLEEIKRSIDVLAKATSGHDDEEVAEYVLLAHVLDRMSLVLYIFAIAVAVPCTQFISH
uniref:CUB domain-containing protein n=1 Tax=Branchiostoma floridae TaxID=7739 RepID=C3XYY8_BRAFL|eukprot:XP_002610749.1 hypothetical protein BRAFLDRAFT_90936 [Branchiostoma floridae]